MRRATRNRDGTDCGQHSGDDEAGQEEEENNNGIDKDEDGSEAAATVTCVTDAGGKGESVTIDLDWIAQLE